MIRVRSHYKRSRKGKAFRVRMHSRTGKARAIERMIQTQPGLTKKEVARLFDTAFESIKQDVKKEGRTSIKGFGIFIKKKIPAKPRRQVRNPFTGQMMWAKPKPAGIKIRFRGGKNFS